MKDTYETLCIKFAKVVGCEAEFKCAQCYDGRWVVQFNFIANGDQPLHMKFTPKSKVRDNAFKSFWKRLIIRHMASDSEQRWYWEEMLHFSIPAFKTEDELKFKLEVLA